MPRAGVLMTRMQAHGVRGGERQLEVRDQILDFRALIEAEAADDDVFAAVAAERLFNLPRLEVGAVKDSDAIAGILVEDASQWRRQ